MSGETTRDVWLGFDLGGTKMMAGLVDEDAKLLGRKRRKTKVRGQESLEQGLTRITETIEKAFDESKVDLARLKGIGIGCPGVLDLKDGVIQEAPNLGWVNVPICQVLEKRFNVPVVLLNDVDAGLFGEFQFGAARGARSALGIFPGTGVGGAFIYDKKLVQGKNRSCMELGHVQVMPEGPLCGCGRRGCLEAVASRLAISAAIAQAAFRGQAPFVREKVGSDMGEIRSSLIAEAVEKEPVVRKIVKQAARQLGIAAGGMIHLLAPDRIVLGGGLVEALPELFRKEVKSGIEEWILPAFKDSFEVVTAELGDDAAVRGAASFAQKKFGKSKETAAVVAASS